MSALGRSWIITYVANGHFLKYTDFSRMTNQVDECHYTHDAAIGYTYVHFKQSIRATALSSFISSICDAPIILFEIFGYESMATMGPNNDIMDHIGMKILLQHFVTKNPAFVSCTDGNPGISRGILWKNDHASRIRDHLKKNCLDQLLFFDTMEQKLQEAKTQEITIELLNEQLAVAQAERDKFKLVADKFTLIAIVMRHRLMDESDDIQARILAPHRGHPLW